MLRLPRHRLVEKGGCAHSPFDTPRMGGTDGESMRIARSSMLSTLKRDLRRELGDSSYKPLLSLPTKTNPNFLTLLRTDLHTHQACIVDKSLLHLRRRGNVVEQFFFLFVGLCVVHRIRSLDRAPHSKPNPTQSESWISREGN